MSSKLVWIVIESTSPIQIPIMNFFESTSSGLGFENNNYTPNWYEPHKIIKPEPPNFLKPSNSQNKEALGNIKLVGVYSNHESAKLAVGCAPNRKILGPSTISL